jgi:hypothetical protein
MPNVPAEELSTKFSGYQAALVVLEKDPARRAILNQLAPAEYTKNASSDLSRSSAIMELKNLHESEATPDFSRVHNTWRKALLSKQITGVAKQVRNGSPTNGMLAQIASDAANALWSERLVSHLPSNKFSPPVINLFEGASRIDWLRRIVWCGRLKLALAGSGEVSGKGSLKSFTKNVPKDWPKLAESTIHQFQATSSAKANCNSHLGLVTVGSLAGGLEPRLRQWLMQHLSMEFGPKLSPWLRIGKPPWPEPQLAMENWIASTAYSLWENPPTLADDSVLEPDPDTQVPSNPLFPGMPPVPKLPQDLFEESIEILSLVSDESALFDLDMPDFDELDLETDDSDPSFRLGDLNL